MNVLAPALALSLTSAAVLLVGCSARDPEQISSPESEVKEIQRIETRNIQRNYDDVFYDYRGKEISPQEYHANPDKRAGR